MNVVRITELLHRRFSRLQAGGRSVDPVGPEKNPAPDFAGDETRALVVLVFDLARICRNERDMVACALRLGQEIDRRDLAIALDEATYRLSRLVGLASAVSSRTRLSR